MELSKLTTEKRNPERTNLDQMSTYEIIKTINNEDKKVAFAVEKVLPKVHIVIDRIVESINNGGRLFYIGSGTSGSLPPLIYAMEMLEKQ